MSLYICTKCKRQGKTKKYVQYNSLLSHFATVHKFNFCNKKQIPALGRDYVVELPKSKPKIIVVELPKSKPKTKIIEEVAKEKNIPVEEHPPADCTPADFKGLPEEKPKLVFHDDFVVASQEIIDGHNRLQAAHQIKTLTTEYAKRYIDYPSSFAFERLREWMIFANNLKKDLHLDEPEDKEYHLHVSFPIEIKVKGTAEPDERNIHLWIKQHLLQNVLASRIDYFLKECDWEIHEK